MTRVLCLLDWCEEPGCRLSHEQPLPAPAPPPPPPPAEPEHPGEARVLCRCSHHASTHTKGVGDCWSVVCGCRFYRPKETTP